jgi:glycosyltransferase involved in cell wall biosynthesis
MNTLISAIIPTHDRPEMLRRAIKSVESQTHSPIELIVVGSPQTGDVRKLVTHAETEQTKYIDASASSPSIARNIGINQANGKYLAFLDDDDEWISNKTETHLDRILETNTGACHVGIRKIGPNGINSISKPKAEGDVTKTLLENKGVYGTVSALMIRRDLAESIAGFDDRLVTCEDGDFNIRLSLHTNFSTVCNPLVNKYTGDYQQVTDVPRSIHKDQSIMISKHQDLAKSFGKSTESAFIANLSLGEGRMAASDGEYSRARHAIFDAVKQNPYELKYWFWFFIVAGGRFTYKPARFLKRKWIRHVI